MIETDVHYVLSADQISGEWFNISSKAAIEAIRTQFEKHGLPIPK